MEHCHHRHHARHSRPHIVHKSKDKQSFSSALLDAICKSSQEEDAQFCSSKSLQYEEELMKTKMSVNANTITLMDVESHQIDYNRHRSVANSSDWSDSVPNSGSYLSSDAESLYRSGARGPRGGRKAESRNKWVSTCMARNNGTTEDVAARSSTESRSVSSLIQQDEPRLKLRTNHRKDSSAKKLKPQHPSSPGRKLASFLNSLFTAGNTNTNNNKHKISSPSSMSVSETTTAASSSYYSSSEKKSSSSRRSCFRKSASKWPTSSSGIPICNSNSDRNSQSHGNKSVMSYPSKEILNDGPRSFRSVSRVETANKMKVRLLERDNQAASAAAQDIIAKYSHDANRLLEAVARDLERQEDDDDNASCASSDLFELQNLSTIDVDEELPVYETTRLDFEVSKNSLAKGLRA